MIDPADANPAVDTTEDGGTSALEVGRFVMGYWRRVPVRFAGMLVGTSLGVILEVQIPRISADLVMATEKLLSGAASSDAAWRSAIALVGVFALVSVVKQIYLRNWMYLASQVMQKSEFRPRSPKKRAEVADSMLA